MSFPLDLSVQYKQKDSYPGEHVMREESETSGLLACS